MTSFTDDGSRLHAAVHCDGDHTVVTLTGELDRVSGPPLARLLDLAMDGSFGHLDLRMAQLGFIDVAGVRLLMQVHRLAADRGVVLALHDPPPHVRWLISTFDGTGLLLGDGLTAAAGARPWDPSPARHRDERDRLADARDERADQRDKLADQRDRLADARDEQADDRDRLAAERDKLIDDRQRRVSDHERWEDIRENLADAREADLERREQTG